MLINQAKVFLEGHRFNQKIKFELQVQADVNQTAPNGDAFVFSQKKLKSGTRYTLTFDFQGDTFIKKVYLQIPLSFKPDDLVLINGIQSWTSTQYQKTTTSISKINPLFFDFAAGSGDSTFFRPNNNKNPWSFDYTVLRKAKNLLFGHYPTTKAYHIFEWNHKNQCLDIHADWGVWKNRETVLIDFVVFENENDMELFNCYFEAINLEKKVQNPVTGWTSWYNYYTNIDRNIITENIENLVRENYAIDFFQIDDGFQKAIGDWTITNAKFPGGMKPEADTIHQKGWKAGLWLAPFICEYKSDIYQNHFDWILKYDDESPVVAGYNPLWGGASHPKYFALDIYNPQFRLYLKNVFDTVLMDWGFDLVKLDFLFAAGLHPRQNKSRFEVMQEAMQLLRKLCGNKLILGCGVPLSPSYQLVDYCRIGPDIGLDWETVWMKAVNVRERISTINAIKNSIARVQLNHFAFGNDPDVFILREENNNLTDTQKKCLLLTNIVCGALVFTSDNVGNYHQELSRLLRGILPHRNKDILTVKMDEQKAQVHFKYLDFEYILAVNYGNKSENFQFPENVFDATNGQLISQTKLQPYEAKVFILPQKNNEIQLAGGSSHLIPGNELNNYKITDNGLTFEINQHAQKGELFFQTEKSELNINGKVYKAKDGRVTIVIG